MQKLKIILLSNKLLVILGMVIFASLIVNSIPKESIIKNDENNFYGQIVDIEKKEEKITFIIKAKEKILCNYYGKENISIHLGDYVMVKGSVKKPSNNSIPNTFNYKKYLNNKNIYNIVTVEKIKIIKENVNIFYKIKNMLMKRIETFDTYDYLNAFILGNIDYIDENIYKSYQNNGIVHLFSISGSHVSLLIGMILFLFKKLKLNKNFSYLLASLILIFYMFLAGFTASILRSGVFFILLSLKKIGYLKMDIIKIFYLTIIFLLILNHRLLNDIGFLYSSSITYGLLISKRIIQGNYLKRVLMISFIAMIVSLPITINNFYEINLLGILYNIFFVPVVSFVITPLSFLVMIFPFLEIIFNIVIIILETVSLKCNMFSFNLVMPSFNLIFCIIYYVLVYLFLKYKRKYFILIICMILLNKLYPYFDYNYCVYFLDVGQGDSTLIKYKDETILIDTGGIISFTGNSTYKVSDQIITFIKSLGLNKISVLVLTHGDYDHMGEAINLVKNFKVENVIFNCREYNELEQELINALDKKKIKYYSCIKELNIDKNKLYFLQTKEYDNENDNSNVIYTELNGYKFMFMGDAGIEKERDILDKYNISNIDVLKVGHHGSKTSSGKEFISEINPEYSIISVGKNNRYGHPNKEALTNLDESKMYRTDQDGSIMFKIINNKLEIEKCPP